MSSNLESEDLENVPLVRMEDVQPVRERTCEIYSSETEGDEVLETCIIDNVDYENECIVDNEEDSNVGSMISIHSEEIIGCDDSDSAEMIVPELITPIHMHEEIEVKPRPENKPESWPTLEILPGGVIKNLEKPGEDLTSIYQNDTNSNDSREYLYECAKCSRSFKFLFCLVKHVRWHESEEKKQRAPLKSKQKEDRYLCLHSKKSKVIRKTNKRRAPKKRKS